MKLSLERLFEIKSVGSDVLEFVLQKSTVKVLKEFIKSFGVRGLSKMKKQDLIDLINQKLNLMYPDVSEVIEEPIEEEFNTHTSMELVVWEPQHGIYENCGQRTFFKGIWDKDTLKSMKKLYNTILHPDVRCKYSIYTDLDFVEMSQEYRIKTLLFEKDVYDLTIEDGVTQSEVGEIIEFLDRRYGLRKDCIRTHIMYKRSKRK